MKDKLVIVDLWGSWQHQSINQKYIDYLESFRQIKLIEFNDILKTSGEKITLKTNNKQRGRIINRFQYFYNIVRVTRKIHKEDKEIFILCYDSISFILFYLLNYDKRIILFQHQHINDLKKMIHKFIIKLYAKNVEHIVLEEKFKQIFLKKIGVYETKVHVCHHPLFSSNVNLQKTKAKNVVSISNSYEKEMLKKFISKIKKINGINFLIRSREESFRNEYIVIENRKYNLEELRKIYEKANIVIVIVEKENFMNRISGTIFDGLSNNCFIFSNDIDIARIIKQKYPNIIEIYDTIDDLIYKIKNINLEDKEKEFLEDLKRFKENYSDKTIINELMKVFGGKI